MSKQREEFENAFEEKLGAHGCQFDLDVDGNYEDRETLCGWLMWQQAQKVAVPDGFILVEKSKLLQILGSAVAINEIPKTKINLSESNFIISEVKAMFEAQEQI